MQKLVIIFLLIYSSTAFTKTETGDVEFGELIASLENIIQERFVDSDVLKHEFKELEKSHNIAASEEIYHDFLRVRLAFEAARDSGLWQIRWDVTDQEPNSDLIWAQWKTLKSVDYLDKNKLKPTATAECDELSALFALIARNLGVKEVGLFWPTFNHTVAVWMPEGKDGKHVRIVIPTSQIFLSKNASLGTKEFDPYKQKTIYQYSRKDVMADYKIPSNLAKMMLEQVKKYGGNSSQVLQKMRNARSFNFDGSWF